jgi:L-ascorbate oxidase
MNLKCGNRPYNIFESFKNGCISANGVNRAIIVANKMMPGPSIEVCLGDTIIVNVFNNLKPNDITSIHWHGVHMKRTNNMDGVSFITQSPILKKLIF